MKKTLFILFSVFTFILNSSAQTINFVAKENINQQFSVSIYNGINIDTIATGQVTMLGMGRFTVPEKYANILAMSALGFGGDAKPVDLILHGQAFSFEIHKGGKLSFTNSSENDLFYNKQSEVMSAENEHSYVQSYVKTLNAIIQLSKVVGAQDRASLHDKTIAKLGVLNDVDVDNLYYSRFWFFAIDGLLRLSMSQEGFANDLIRLIDKTKTDKVFLALVEDIIMITNQYGMDDAFDIVIPHVKELNRIEYPQGSLYDAFEMIKVMKGSAAPKIAGLKPSIEEARDKYSLLIFHQPSCEMCHVQLEKMKQEYNYFKEKGVRIVSISGVLDKDAFAAESKDFQWEDKLCDYKGYGGENYMNFGITGTPTFFLIDNTNIIIKRFATVLEVQNYLNGAL